MKKKTLAALLALALIIAGITPATLALNAAAAGINSFGFPENEEISPEYIAGGQDSCALAEGSGEPQNPSAPGDDGISVSKTVEQEGDGYKITMEAYTTGTVTFTNPTVPVDVVLVLDQSGTMRFGFNGKETEYENSRQKAMQDAVKNFIDKVHEKYNEETSDHRIAIVTFGDKANVLNNWTFVDNSGKAALDSAIDNLPQVPDGLTATDKGMQKAAELMGDGYNYNDSNTQRQKVVILFTDGAPDDNSASKDDFTIAIADRAIAEAKTLKENGCIVYSIGIFENANPNELYGDPIVDFPNPKLDAKSTAEAWAKGGPDATNDHRPYWDHDYEWSYVDDRSHDTIHVPVVALEDYLHEKCPNPIEGDVVGYLYLRKKPTYTGSSWLISGGTHPVGYRIFVYHESQWVWHEDAVGYPSKYHHGGRTGEIGYWWWWTYQNAGTSNPHKKASVPAANRFMNLVSSNYQSADNFGLKEWVKDRNKYDHVDYTKKLGFEITANYDRTAAADENYYFTADNAEQLNNIFEEVSGQIGNVTTPIELTGEAYIKDVVSPYFTPPTGLNNVKLYTADYKGGNQWENKAEAADPITAALEGDTLKVTGFDYTANFVSETGRNETDPTQTGNFRGRKLIVEMTGIKPNPNFIGGNNVPTNGAASGVYAPGEEGGEPTCIETFPVPTVDVPISDYVSVTAPNKNVYLYGTLTDEQLKAGVTATTGEVTLQLDAENYGLQPWQYEFVNITPTVSPGSFTALTEDKTYTVSVTIKLKTGDNSNAKSGSAIGNIYVFKPEITFKDEKIETDTVNLTDNQVGRIVWKHETTASGSVTMIGDEPQLDYSYSIDDREITTPAACPVGFTEDKYVKVTVKINGNDVTAYVIFKHDTCSIIDDCPLNNPENAALGQFMLHLMNNCTLTITKQAASGTFFTPGESFIFRITGANDFELEVVLTVGADGAVPSVTIDHLRAGEYTVTEDTGWSWRYTAEGENSKQVTVTASLPGAVTVTNILTVNKWLNGEAHIDNRWQRKNGNYEIVCD